MAYPRGLTLCMGAAIDPPLYQRTVQCLEAEDSSTKCRDLFKQTLDVVQRSIEEAEKSGPPMLLSSAERDAFQECASVGRGEEGMACLIPRVCPVETKALSACLGSSSSSAQCRAQISNAMDCLLTFNVRLNSTW